MLRIRIRLRYRPWGIPGIVLALGLLLLAALIVPHVHHRRALAANPQIPAAVYGKRQYYLSRSRVQAYEARNACAAGYHFASIWEIVDPSALDYNTTLGLFGPDSGGGPPSTFNSLGVILTAYGWVRTGYAFSGSDTTGQANCSTWLTNDSFSWGTVANLPSDWSSGEQDMGVWNVGSRTCNAYHWVWCVQDDGAWRVYLPLTLRDI